jgi:hypothetical protein
VTPFKNINGNLSALGIVCPNLVIDKKVIYVYSIQGSVICAVLGVKAKKRIPPI